MEIQLLGPTPRNYSRSIKSCIKDFSSKDIDISFPKIKSDAKWSSVIVQVDSDVPMKYIEPIVEKIFELHEKEEDPKTDISILNKSTGDFYDLPQDWKQFMKAHRKKSKASS